MRNQRSFTYAQSYAASNCDAQIFTVGRVTEVPGRASVGVATGRGELSRPGPFHPPF